MTRPTSSPLRFASPSAASLLCSPSSPPRDAAAFRNCVHLLTHATVSARWLKTSLFHFCVSVAYPSVLLPLARPSWLGLPSQRSHQPGLTTHPYNAHLRTPSSRHPSLALCACRVSCSLLPGTVCAGMRHGTDRRQDFTMAHTPCVGAGLLVTVLLSGADPLAQCQLTGVYWCAST